jgi:hypothetical protein
VIRHQTLAHQFVRNAPRELEPGVLYISVEYATAVHSCCCGCGERVITPFTPTDWQMTFDGNAVSLHPSVGNWNQECRSHYVIKRNRVVDAGPWTCAQIEAERRRDKLAKSAYFAASAEGSSAGKVAAPRTDGPPVRSPVNGHPARSSWSGFWTWFVDRVGR